MKCEVCGREIPGKPIHAIIEGAKLLVCPACAKYSSGTWKERRRTALAAKTARPALKARPRRVDLIGEELELVDGYGEVVRRARERRGWSQEDLGRAVGEKASVIRRIEREAMAPSISLAKKLEHALGVKLLAPPSETPTPPTPAKTPTLTLGDLIKLHEKGKEG